MGTWTNRGVVDATRQATTTPVLRALLVTTLPTDSTIRDWDTVGQVGGEVTTGQVANYGRATLTGVEVVQGADGVTRLRCDDINFGRLNPGATPAGVVIFRRQGPSDAGADPVWLAIPFGTPRPTNGGQFTVAVPRAGIAGWAAHLPAPTADAGPDQTVATPVFTLSGTGSHPGLWTQLHGPGLTDDEAVILAPRSATTSVVVADGVGPAHSIVHSATPDRANPRPLDTAVARSPLHVFLTPDTVAGQVTWRVDGTPVRTVRTAPFDLAGTTSGGDAVGLELAPGLHTITADIVQLNGASVPTVAALFDVVEESAVAVGPLAWAPPEGWDQFTEIVLEAGDVVDGRVDVVMDADTDYRITCTEPLPGRVNLRGGRHVVWIGGEVDLVDQGDLPRPPAARWGIWIDDAHGDSGITYPGRVIHLEGLWVHGEDLAVGVACNDPQALIRLQHCRIGPLRSRSAADEQGGAPYYETAQTGRAAVPVGFTPVGGCGGLYCDRVTILTGGHGLLTRSAGQTINPNPEWWLRRVNVRCVTYTSRGDRPGRATNTGVRVATGATALLVDDTAPAAHLPGRVHAEDVWVDHPSLPVDQLIGYGPTRPVDNGDGTWSFTGLDHPTLGGAWFTRWDLTGPARFAAGQPAAGDWSPAEVAGVGYVTPGYDEQEVSP